MKFCTECGAALAGNPKFCAECGTRLPNPVFEERDSGGDISSSEGDLDVCSDCGTDLEDGAHFCIECGSNAGKAKQVYKPEPIPIAQDTGAGNSANEAAEAGFLAALWGGSASCGCGCFSLILVLGLLLMVGAFL